MAGSRSTFGTFVKCRVSEGPRHLSLKQFCSSASTFISEMANTAKMQENENHLCIFDHDIEGQLLHVEHSITLWTSEHSCIVQ